MNGGGIQEDPNIKMKDLYTQLNPSDKPESVLKEIEGGQQTAMSSNSSASYGLPSSTAKFTNTLPSELKTRSRRYKHRRSKSHENYAKIISPRHSPHVERVRI